MSTVPALDVVELKKTYANGVEALKGVSLTVQPGDFFALLGPNGAGKSTLIGILSSLVNASEGDARIFGVSIRTQRSAAMRLIGLVPQELNFNMFEKPFDICVNSAGFYGIPRAIAAERAEKYLKQLVLWDKAFQPARAMSGGMKRRLMVAKAMVHSPPILILDEPTAGVDVELRRSLWEYVRKLNAQGVTIVLTTHYLEEAQEMCDEIAIVNHGQIIACEPTAKLLRRLNHKTLVVRPEQALTGVPAALSDLSPTIRKDGQLAITYKMGEQSIEQLLKRLREANVGIGDLATEEPDLEDVFVSLTSS